MGNPSIGVVIPVHPPRDTNGMLDRALKSVHRQTLRPAEVHVVTDTTRAGGRATRNRGIFMVKSEWTALIDSDDEWNRDHLRKCYDFAVKHDADFVYPWYTVVGGKDPRPATFGKPFDPAHPFYTTITVLVRTEIAREAARRLPRKEDDPPPRRSDDYAFMLECRDLGAKIVHLPEKTWKWYHHGKNTSSRTDRGDAKSGESRVARGAPITTRIERQGRRKRPQGKPSVTQSTRTPPKR